MKEFKPSLPFNVSFVILAPTTKNVSGVLKKTFPTIEEAVRTESNIFYGNFKTYGGTERDVNGIYSIEDTANVETWYRPDITSNCRVARDDGAIFEIINEPEDINRRRQYLKFKVRRIKGGA